MKLLELRLTNFKGLRDCTLNFDGRDASITALNGVGKTTIEDSFLWLLTGKDHMGRTDMNFSIKTLDESGQPIPMLDHSVSATIEHDGTTVELTRTFKEVWTKKTGTNERSFTGHKTEYYISSVPKSEKEYSAFIERIAPLKLVCLLTMTGYFNEQLKWEARRRLLLETFGDVDEAELLAQPQFAELAPHITKLVSVPDLKKSMTAQKAKINDDLKSIPVAINVHSQYLAASDGLQAAVETEAVKSLSAQIEAAQAEKNALYSGEGIADLRRQLEELRAVKAQAKAEQRERREAAERETRARLNAANDRFFDANARKHSLEREICDLNAQISFKEMQRKDALSRYNAEDAKTFSADPICPTCGQAYPEEHMQTVREQFNENKAKTLEAIIVEGKGYAGKIEKSHTKLIDLEARLTACSAEADAAQKALDAIKAESGETAPDVPFDDSAIQSKKNEIAQFNESISGKETEIQSKIDALKTQNSVHEQNLAAIRNAENAAKEIESLKAKEKTLSASYEECERIISLCDEFTSAKVKLLDDKISGAFRFVRFKLTEKLVNGGMKECCETLINGVPYSAANTAAQMQASLDIIEAFQRRYDVTLPVFVDKRESIMALPTMDCQMISLIVPTPFDSLPDYFRDYLIEQNGNEKHARAAYEEPYKTLKLEVL